MPRRATHLPGSLFIARRRNFGMRRKPCNGPNGHVTSQRERSQPTKRRCKPREAIRETHHSISREGFEAAIPRLLQDAFEFEIQLGTAPQEAAFHVTAGYQKYWRRNDRVDTFGSWVVDSYQQPCKAAFDGKTGCLALYDGDKPAIWQGHIDKLRESGAQYFSKLIYL
jgi:hypothetical protein